VGCYEHINNIFIRIVHSLMHYPTSFKVAGSKPDEANTFFNIPNHSSRTGPCLLTL
jgi:hypothetical protein